MNVLKQGLALVAFAATVSVAHANTTYETFVNVAGSVSFDGWNQINRAGLGCADSACSTAALVAGITANVEGSGDAVLKRVSGDHYPAGSGLYGGNSVLTFTDNTIAAGTTALVFQGIINNFSGTPFSLTLNYNGGSQALAATSSTFTDTGTAADLYTYTWDLSGLTAPLSSYTLTLGAGFSQMLAFQVDQVNVSAVPEPTTYALLIGGLALVGGAARRRQQAAARA